MIKLNKSIITLNKSIITLNKSTITLNKLKIIKLSDILYNTIQIKANSNQSMTFRDLILQALIKFWRKRKKGIKRKIGIKRKKLIPFIRYKITFGYKISWLKMQKKRKIQKKRKFFKKKWIYIKSTHQRFFFYRKVLNFSKHFKIRMAWLRFLAILINIARFKRFSKLLKIKYRKKV